MLPHNHSQCKQALSELNMQSTTQLDAKAECRGMEGDCNPQHKFIFQKDPALEDTSTRIQRAVQFFSLQYGTFSFCSESTCLQQFQIVDCDTEPTPFCTVFVHRSEKFSPRNIRKAHRSGNFCSSFTWNISSQQEPPAHSPSITSQLYKGLINAKLNNDNCRFSFRSCISCSIFYQYNLLEAGQISDTCCYFLSFWI